MARSKKPTKKAAKSTFQSLRSLDLAFLNRIPVERLTSWRPNKGFYTSLLIAGLLLLAVFKKDWFVAAIVNGQPITNFEVLSALNRQYRTQTLNQMINEKLFLQEVAKNNVLPSQEEIDNRISEIEKSIGGSQNLDSALSQQGQTRDSLKGQIKIQLAIEKLYANQATVSAEEIDKFIETNKDSLRATDSADQRKEAEDMLKQQKLSQIFQQKFQELRKRASIQVF